MRPSIQRSLAFEDFHMNKQIVATPFKVHRNIGRRPCISLCLLHPDCLSVSYCGDLTCMLNSVDKFSFGVTLQSENRCDYQGMFKDEVPFCAAGKSAGDETQGMTT